MKSLSLISEPCGASYASLLEAALAHCSSFYLMTLDDQPYDESAQRIRLALRPFLQSSSRVKAWPGTQLLGTTGAILESYRLDAESAEVLRGAADCLYDWRSPGLPEDLGFRRADGSLWLASVAHERDAWWELRADELSTMRTGWPDLAGLVDAM